VFAGAAAPQHGWGQIEKGDIGTVTRVEDGECRVDFDKQSGWNGVVWEMMVVKPAALAA